MRKQLLILGASLVCALTMGQPGPNDGTSFNGIDEFILMPDSDNINTTPVDNRTIETYFKVNDATNRQVFYKEGANVNTVKFYVEDGNLIVGSYRDSGGSGESIWFRTPISNNTWYHVAIVLDSASTLRFYLDGVLQAENLNYFQLPVHPGNFEIARTQGQARYPNCNTWGTNSGVEECLGDVTNNDSTVLYFGGSVYGFRIWNDVRTAQEIDDNKDLIFTDPNIATGEGLIAFLAGNTMSYQDDSGDFETEDVQGNVLNLEETNKNDFKVVNGPSQIQIISPNNVLPQNITLFDLLGKAVISASNTDVIAKRGLRNGIYILKISDNGRVLNRKILIQN